MAAELREAFPGVDVALLPSSGGRFEVIVDGAAVFEKSKLGRHAHAGEIVQLLHARRPAAS